MLNFDLANIIMILINLIVLVVIMRLVAIKPIRNMLNKREELINGRLNTAAGKEASARALEKEWNDKLKGVDAESQRLIAEARSKADAEYNRLVGDARREADGIVETARKNMQDEHDKVMEDVQSEIAGLAIDITKKVLESSDLKGINDSLYEKFLTEAGDEHDSVGD